MTDIFNPISGQKIAEVPEATTAEVNAAFEKARVAYQDWSTRSPRERGMIMRRITDKMLIRAEDIAIQEAKNIGFPIASARAMAKRAAETFTYFGGYADKIVGENIPVEEDLHTYTRREPYGTVVALVPWNAPIIFATKKIAPAIAFGNVCILKPAEESPLTSLMLQEIIEESEMPPGVVQILPGGRAVGEALVSDPRTNLVVFTGSDATGRQIAKRAADNFTPVALELGGKSPQLVFDDADLDRARHGVLTGIFSEAGQACIAGSRLYVQENIYDEFMETLGEHTRSIRVGDPLHEDTQVGPQATRKQQKKSLKMIEQALADGAELYAQARMPVYPGVDEGYFVQPTILTGVARDQTIMREEVFGPVLAVGTFKDEAEAIEIANDTEFGLAAGIWTKDVGRAHRVAAKVHAGNVYVNTYFHVSDQVPFGGMGRSGYGREGGSSAIDLYTQVKTVWTSLTPGIPDDIRF